MEGRKKAVVAGHICIDITPVFPEGKGTRLGEILSPGKLIHMKGADIHTGGAVANTGLAMKILGADVSLMGKVGEDEFGALVLELLKKYDAQEGMIVSPGGRTSYSVVLAVPGIDRIFLHDPGANDDFSSEDLDFERIREADLFHFGYPPIMKKIFENEGEELLRLLKKVKECGAAVSLDMAAIDPDSEAGKADWKKILQKVLPYVDFFVPSVEELCFMLDPERYESWQKRPGGGDVTEKISLEDIRPLGEQVLKLGAGTVLIKCGAPGMYYRTCGGEKMRELCRRLNLSVEDWEEKEGFEKSYVPEKVLSGTGAGDTSIAAFLCSILEERPLCECLQMAAATGASCVAAYDALSGLQPLKTLREKIKNGWKKAGE